MPALRYSEDTEFNDALRAQGILPALPAEPSSPELTPSRELQPQQLIEQVDNQKVIDELELDEQIPASVIDSWKSARLSELNHANKILNAQLPGLKPIGKEDYVREVNQASEVDIDPNSERKGTGVVICLWNNSSASKHILSLLDKLSHQYPSTRFLTIPGGLCIANYPDVNQPTLICYRAGSCLKQYVGIGSSLEISKNNGRLCAGLSLTLTDLEVEFLSIGILDEHLKIQSVEQPSASQDSDYDDKDDDDARLNKPISKRNIRVTSKTDSDSELDI